MGQETYLANLINNASQPVLDFNGQVFRIDATVSINTTNQVWREIRNLTIEAEGSGSYVALSIPRWSGAYHKRKLSNIKITKTGTTRVGTGIEVRPTSVVLSNVQVKEFDKGLVLKGLNLGMIRESLFDSNNTGVEIDRDTDFGGNGYRGNDTHFFNCRFRQNTNYGVRFLPNAIESGNAAGNFNTFTKCNFEYTGLTDTANATRYLLKLENGNYNLIEQCRFEMDSNVSGSSKTLTSYCLWIGTDGVGGSQCAYTRVEDCIFSASASATSTNTSTIHALYLDSNATYAYYTRNEFDSAVVGSGGTETANKITNSSTYHYGTDNSSIANNVDDCVFLSKTSPGTVYTLTLSGSYQAIQPTCTLSSFSSSGFGEFNEADAAADSHIRYTGGTPGLFLMTLNINCTMTNMAATPTITIRTEYYYSGAWTDYGSNMKWVKAMSATDNGLPQQIALSGVIKLGNDTSTASTAKYLRITAARSTDACDLNIYGFQWSLTRIS